MDTGNQKEGTRFNRRRRVLMRMTEAIPRYLTATLMDPEDRIHVVDNALIPLCTYTRGREYATVAGAQYCGVGARSHHRAARLREDR